MSGQAIAVTGFTTFLLLWSIALMQSRGMRYSLAVWLGWAVPGLGHAIVGRPLKGGVFFLMLAAVYATGLVLLSGHSISFEDHPFYYIGQYGSGLTWLLAELLGNQKPYPNSAMPVSWFDPGLLYLAAPGLLNLVIVLNLFQARTQADNGDAPAKEPKDEPAGKEAASK